MSAEWEIICKDIYNPEKIHYNLKCEDCHLKLLKEEGYIGPDYYTDYHKLKGTEQEIKAKTIIRSINENEKFIIRNIKQLFYEERTGFQPVTKFISKYISWNVITCLKGFCGENKNNHQRVKSLINMYEWQLTDLIKYGHILGCKAERKHVNIKKIIVYWAKHDLQHQ